MATKKKREDLSQAGSGSSFDNPFAKLASIKSELPEGPAAAAPESVEPGPTTKAAARKIVVRRERAGRGGKTVTLIEGLALGDAALAALAKDLKRALGCGAVVEGSAIVLQGDLEERAATLLEQRALGPVVLGTRKR